MECYKAYTEGRAEKNPAEYWYQGEIGFYGAYCIATRFGMVPVHTPCSQTLELFLIFCFKDFYIIPLARKLATCGVFGVSSDEYLVRNMLNPFLKIRLSLATESSHSYKSNLFSRYNHFLRRTML